MSKKIKKFVPNRHSGWKGHLTAASKLFCGKTLYLFLILFLSIALFAGLIFTVGGGSNGFLSNKPQDVSNAASSTPSNTSGTWITDGRQASGFAGGSGTADDPYQIATAPQLALLAKNVYNGTVGGIIGTVNLYSSQTVENCHNVGELSGSKRQCNFFQQLHDRKVYYGGREWLYRRLCGQAIFKLSFKQQHQVCLLCSSVHNCNFGQRKHC